jgi:hypothetical protein
MLLVDRHALDRSPRPSSRQGSTLPLAIAFFIALGFGACGFIGYALWPTWPSAEAALDAPALPITVAGTPFNIPPSALRIAVQRRAGAHERVDLAFLWPSLDPPDLAAKSPSPAPDALATAKPAFDRIFVTIAAAGDTLAPEERVRTIYPRYATAAPLPGPEGLAVLAFRAGTPYEGEDLIYDATTPANFLVRCTRPAGVTPGNCLLSRRIGKADIVVRFPRDWLGDWPFVGRNIERLISSLVASSPD